MSPDLLNCESCDLNCQKCYYGNPQNNFTKRLSIIEEVYILRASGIIKKC